MGPDLGEPSRRGKVLLRESVDEVRLNWLRALGFARLALSAVGQLRPGWPVKAARYLGRAEAMLNVVGPH